MDTLYPRLSTRQKYRNPHPVHIMTDTPLAPRSETCARATPRCSSSPGTIAYRIYPSENNVWIQCRETDNEDILPAVSAQRSPLYCVLPAALQCKHGRIKRRTQRRLCTTNGPCKFQTGCPAGSSSSRREGVLFLLLLHCYPRHRSNVSRDRDGNGTGGYLKSTTSLFPADGFQKNHIIP
jgi:hypothetical protein